MPSIQVQSAVASLTADGASNGEISVADTNSFYVGAEANMFSSTKADEVIITEIVSSTKLRVKLKDSKIKFGGGSDMSGYTVAESAKIAMPAQVVRVQQPSFVAPTKQV